MGRSRSPYSLVLLILGILFGSLSGEEIREEIDELPIVESSREQELSLTLVLDHKRLGEVLAIITQDGHIAKVRAADLIDVLGEENCPFVIHDVEKHVDLNDWVPVEKLSYYSPQLDLEHFILIFKTPAEDKPKQTIEYNKQNYTIPSNAIPAAPKTAYVNFRNNYTYTSSSHRYFLDGDGAIRIDPWVFEGRFDFDSTRHTPFGHQDLRFVRDFPETCRRLTIGEDQAFRPLLLSADRIHGIKYSTEFNIRPNLITDPISEFAFFLERDSIVEVWVNGEERDLLKLSSGSYDVRNLALTAGFNEVVLKIRDDLGNKETLTFSAIRGPNLLCPGIEQYDISVGAVGRGEHYGGKPVFSYFYRRGLNDWFTLEAEGRLANKVQGIGIGGTYALRFCYGEWNVARSFNEHGSGSAYRAIFSRDFGKIFTSFRFDYQESKFLNQFDEIITSRLHHSERWNVNCPMPWVGGNITGQFINSTNWEGDPVQKLEVSWYYTFWNDWRLTLTAIQSTYDNPRSEFKGVLTYNCTGDTYNRSHTLRYRHDLKSLRSTINGTPGQGWPADWKFTHYHDINKGNDHTDSINTTFDYLNNRFSTNYSGWVDEIGNQNQFEHNITVSSAIAYCGGKWGVTRPIRDSFAIVDENIEDLDTDFIITREGGKEQWKSTRRMPGVVSDLRSYHPTRIYIDTGMTSVDMSSHDFVVYPAYRSGTLISVGDKEEEFGSLVLGGILVDEEGKPLENKAFRVYEKGNEENEALISFTNKMGQFVISGAMKNRDYLIKVYGGEGLEYEFSSPAMRVGDEMISLGTLSPVVREGS